MNQDELAVFVGSHVSRYLDEAEDADPGTHELLPLMQAIEEAYEDSLESTQVLC